MDGIYGQTGMMPHGMPMPGTGGGDSPFEIAWRGKWLILISAVLGLGGAYGFSRTLKPEYTSASRVLVEKPRATRPADLLPPGATATNYLQQQASILLSREILGSALSDPNVVVIPTFSPEDRLQAAVRTLSAKVRKDNIITVSASSANPHEAAALVNAVVRAYRQWHEANKQLGTAELLKDLDDKLEASRKDLARKRQDLALLEQGYPGLVEDTRGGLASRMLEDRRQEVATARLYRIQQESYYNRLMRLESDPNKLRQYALSHGCIMDDGEWSRLVDALCRTRSELDALACADSNDEPQLAVLRNRENRLVERIAGVEKDFVRRQIDLAGALSEDAKGREHKLVEIYEEKRAELQSTEKAHSEYARLRTECRMLERMCVTLQDKIKCLEVGSRVNGLKIRVLEAALPAAAPSCPGKMALLAGLALGLAVGISLSFVCGGARLSDSKAVLKAARFGET